MLHRPLLFNQSQISVLCLVDQLVAADPWHHAAQLLADFFDLVLVVIAADSLEARCPGLVFLHPVGSELAGLDVGQDTLHLGLGFGM